MNYGSIWWNQLGTSLRFIAAVENKMTSRRSTVLHLNTNIPWRHAFYDAVNRRFRSKIVSIDENAMEIRTIRKEYKNASDPGEFVLKQICGSSVWNEYHHSVTKEKFLAQRESLLCRSFVWITGIRKKADLAAWVDFVSKYELLTKDRTDTRGVFILEYTGEGASFGDLDGLSYAVESYDCRVFCLEAANCQAPQLRRYLAEMALRVGHNDPELCAALLESGDALILDPLDTTKKVLSTAFREDMTPFPSYTDDEIRSAAWEAAVVLYFPVLERFRLNFIADPKRSAELHRHLPIKNSHGQTVDDVQDLEVGSVYFLAKRHKNQYTPQEVSDLKFCSEIRNDLAHLRPITYANALRLEAM